jgi:hypothetical protein
MRKKRVCGNKIVSAILFCTLLLLWYTPDFEYSALQQAQNGTEKTEELKTTVIQKNSKDEAQFPLNNQLNVENKVKPDIQIKKTEERTVQVVKQPLTLNSLATGFNAYANNKIENREKKHDVSITETRFLEKIVSCIQTSFFINTQKIISYLYSEKTIDIFIELNRNGFLNGIVVSKTSGDRFFDDFMKNLIEEGAKSFPPIPQLIEKVPYRLVTRISFEYGVSLQLLLPR